MVRLQSIAHHLLPLPVSLLVTLQALINTSGGFRNLESGVQPLVCEAHLKLLGCYTYFQSRECIHDTRHY